MRPHYVARLAALDTGERDRALAGNDSNDSSALLLLLLHFYVYTNSPCSSELEKTKVELRELQLRETELQVPIISKFKRRVVSCIFDHAGTIATTSSFDCTTWGRTRASGVEQSAIWGVTGANSETA